MPLLQIHDRQPQSIAVVDPRVVLPILGKRAIRASWQIAGVARFDEPLFATDEGADQLEALSQTQNRISGVVLSEIFREVVQIIWGEFTAYEESETTPWVIIRAIDSTWCEVETDDEDVLERVRRAFSDVRVQF